MDKELLQRYVEGNVTNQEVATVVDWLNESEENVREYMTLHKLYGISLFNQPPAELQRENTKKAIPYRRIGYELLKIAAIFFLFWGIKGVVDKGSEVEIQYQSVFVPPGQRAELMLPDSTKVWLNAKSKITFPTHFDKGSREVRLEGEAYFDVKHNEKQLFVVKTEKIDIQVLGTEFNVLAYENSPVVEVALLKGSVRIKDINTSQLYAMNPNERVQIKDKKFHLSQIPEYDYFQWKEGLLSFHNESVTTILEKLQLYFDVKIEVDNQKLLTSRYSGKFQVDDGVEQVLKVLQLEHKFIYTRNTDLNLITIK